MTHAEVLEALWDKYRINISRHTLLRYEKAGMIPEAQRGGGGRGVGRWSDYPPQTVEMAAIAYNLIHRVIAKHMNLLTVENGGSEVTEQLHQKGTIVDLSEIDSVVQDVSHLIETGTVKELFVVVQLESGGYLTRWCGDLLSLLKMKPARTNRR